MRFAVPYLLTLLILGPALLLAYALSFSHRRRLLARLGQDPRWAGAPSALLARMAASVSTSRRVLHAAAVVLAVLLLAVVLARPQVGGRAKLLRQRGMDVVVVLDLSRSMLARDIYPSRLERAKRELDRLLDRLSGDRVGLVVFAGETMSYPPSTDYAALKLFWRDLGPEDIPVGGSALARALQAALELLAPLRQEGGGDEKALSAPRPPEGPARSQVILLLTDGEETEEDPLPLADRAAERGVKIFAVGLGTRAGELIPEVGPDAALAGYMKDEKGQYVTSRLAEGLLAQLAEKTGGAYFRAEAKHFGVERLEEALATLKRAENESRVVKQYDDIYQLFLLPVFLLLVAEACASDRRREVRP